MHRPSPSSTASHAAPRSALGRIPRPSTTTASMRALSSNTTAATAQYYGGAAGSEGAPMRRTSSSTSNVASAPLPTTPTRQMRAPAPSRQQQPQPRPLPVPMQMQPEPQPRAFLARSDVVDKQVIARTSGRCLGVVDHMFVDSETYRVVSVELRAKGLAAAAGIAASAVSSSSSSSNPGSSVSTWGARPPQQQQRMPSSTSMQLQQQQPTGTNLPLATLCQVGDVVLVHDERALSFPPLDDGSGRSFTSPRAAGGRYSRTPPPRLVRLTGAEVVTADGSGQALGKVRGYGFDPETGELLALRFDALGLPRIPEGAMVVTEVPISAVLSLDQSQQWGDPSAPLTVVLRPGADEDGSIYLVSEGLFGKALEKLNEVLRSGTEFDDGFDDDEDDLYEEVEFAGRGARRRNLSAAAASSAAAPGSSRQRVVADRQFEAWREAHGEVFARYYGLPSVPRTRAELDRAMAEAANPNANASSSPSPSARRQQQQRSPSPAASPPRATTTRAALPPPSRGSFSDALRPADPRARERAFETLDAFDAPTPRQQQQQRRAPPPQVSSSSWPAPPASTAEDAWRELPRRQAAQRSSSSPLGEEEEGNEIAAAEARWGAPPPPPRSSSPPPPPSSSSVFSPAGVRKPRVNGISILPTRSPRPPGLVRDADGGFGSGKGEAGAGAGEAAAAGASAPATTGGGGAPSTPPAVVSELSFGAPVPDSTPPAPVAETVDDGIDGSAW